MIKFDFVVNYLMYNKLEELAGKEGKKVCEIVYKILVFMLPMLQMKHLKEERRGKDYPFVDGKIRIRVTLPEILYNQLKMIHDHLNTFSMAVLIREIIIEYFSGVEKHGEEGYKKEVKKTKERLKFMKSKHCSWLKIDNVEDIPYGYEEQFFYSIKLDQNFCLQEFKFL